MYDQRINHQRSAILPLSGDEVLLLVQIQNGIPVPVNVTVRALLNMSGSTDGGSTGVLLITGGTMSGPLFLARVPVGALEAATKSYVDAQVAAVPASSVTKSYVDTQDASIATTATNAAITAANSHVDSVIGGRVADTGDTMTGPLLLAGTYGSGVGALDLRNAGLASGSHAIWLPTGGDIALDSAGTRLLRYDPTAGETLFLANGVPVASISDDGDISSSSVNGAVATQVPLGQPGQEWIARGTSSAPAWTDKPWINAEDPRFGTVGDGVADDTVALQAALDAVQSSGGIVTITKPHVVSSALRVSAGTTIIGYGGVLTASTAWPLPITTDYSIDPGYAMVVNENFTASSSTDHDIAIVGLTFDWSALQAAKGGRIVGSHAIRLRKVQRSIVQNCLFLAGDSGVVIMSPQNSKVIFCTVYDSKDVGIWHMEAPVDSLVQSCTIRMAASSPSVGVGICFTATDNLSTPSLNASRCRAFCNDIFGPTGGAANSVESAIRFETVGTGCSIINCQAAVNTINGQGAMTNGIVVAGVASRIYVSENSVNATSRTTGKDILVAGNDCVVAGNPTDNPSGFAASTSVTGSRNVVWGYETNGDTIFVGNLKAASYL